MSTRQSFIGEVLREWGVLSVWIGYAVSILGLGLHALGQETEGLVLVFCGVVFLVNGVAEQVEHKTSAGEGVSDE